MAEDVVVLTGIKETLDALSNFDADAVARFNRVINDELDGAERNARASIDSIKNKTTDTPMSGWRKSNAMNPTQTRGGKGWPGWDASVVKAGIKQSKAEGRVRRKNGYLKYTTSAGSLRNESAAGAIFEIAGRKSDGEGTGVSFINTLTNRFQAASRTIWRTVDRDRPRIEANVAKALEQAKAELQRHLNREQA
jgi:hypothetical protein